MIENNKKYLKYHFPKDPAYDKLVKFQFLEQF